MIFYGCTNSVPSDQTKQNLPLGPTIAQLQTMKFVTIKFEGLHSFYGNNFDAQSHQFFYSGGSFSDTLPNRLIWQNGIFTSNIYIYGGSHNNSNTLIKGAFSYNNLYIDSFVCSQSNDQGYESNGSMGHSFNYNTFDSKMSGINIPFFSTSDTLIIFSSTGPLVKNLLSVIQMSGEHHFNTHPGGFDYDVPFDYQSTEWGNDTLPPKLIIKFYK